MDFVSGWQSDSSPSANTLPNPIATHEEGGQCKKDKNGVRSLEVPFPTSAWKGADVLRQKEGARVSNTCWLTFVKLSWCVEYDTGRGEWCRQALEVRGRHRDNPKCERHLCCSEVDGFMDARFQWIHRNGDCK